MTHTLPEAPVLLEKWEEVLNEESSPKIISHERRVATAMVLENQARALAEDAPTNSGFGGANFAKWDPVLMTLVRRSMPNLMHLRCCWCTANVWSYRHRVCNEVPLQRC